MAILIGVLFIIVGTIMVEKIAEKSICQHEALEEYRNYRRYLDRYTREAAERKRETY